MEAPSPQMIRLTLLGVHTRLGSTLCAACPQGSTGCCAGPPDVDWADIGRIVSLGGRSFLLAEIASKNLIPWEGGLRLRRVRKRTSPLEPRRARCVYHGPEGCTIAPSQRPAACNYFLCQDAFTEGGEGRGDPVALSARAAHAALSRHYKRSTERLAERIRSLWPEGPRWDVAFLDWLGAEFERLSSEANALPELAPPAP
jgi:hypothetical protein